MDRIEALLDANDLPSRDVREKPGCFFVASADGVRIGIGGVEQYGPAGLLRSVVVADPYRGRGYGARLCAALENRARTDGVARLYLLTTTATGFFRRQGYETVAWADVPASIRATPEFTDLCPRSAACLTKPLDREG